MTDSTTPAGWYPDPQNPSQTRYWDGASWTEHTAPASTTPSPVVVAAMKKPIYKRTWFIVLACVFAVGVFANLFGNDAPDSATPTNVQSASTQSESDGVSAKQPAPSEQAVNTGEQQAEPEAESEPKWVKVASLEGSAAKRSKTFKITSDEVELKYSVKGSTMSIFAVYVVPKGDSIQKTGGIPEVMISEAGKDTTMLVKDPGEYYLDVNAANCKWTVTIREKR